MIDIKLNIISLVGMYVLCIVAWLSSENRKLVPWDVIKWGIGTQFVMGFLIFVFPITRLGVEHFGNAINFLLEASEAGARFLFSGLIVPPVDKIMVKPTDLINPATGTVDYSYIINPKTGFFERSRLDLGFIFAFRSLPQVIPSSGIMILEITKQAGIVRKDAAIKCPVIVGKVGRRKPAYIPRTVEEIEPKQLARIAQSSLLVMLSKKGLTATTDSIPTKILAAPERDSAPLVPIVFWKIFAKKFTTGWIAFNL